MHIFTFVYTASQYFDIRRSVTNLLEFNNYSNRFRLLGTPSVLRSRQCAQQTFPVRLPHYSRFPPAPPFPLYSFSPLGFPVFRSSFPSTNRVRLRLAFASPLVSAAGGGVMVSGFCVFWLRFSCVLLHYFLPVFTLLLQRFSYCICLPLLPLWCGRCVFPVPRCGGGSLESRLLCGLTDIFSPPLLVR